MSPEMVERVAYQLRIRYDPAHPSMDDCARYALALADAVAKDACRNVIACLPDKFSALFADRVASIINASVSHALRPERMEQA